MKAFELKTEWFTCLDKVLETGSIRLAAQSLYMSEQSLRYNLKALAKFLGRSLFDDSATALTLHPDVSTLFDQGLRFNHSLEQMQGHLLDLACEGHEFRVAISQAYPCLQLNPLLVEIRQLFPRLQIAFNLHHLRELERRIGYGEYDVGLTTWEPEIPHLAWRKGPTWSGIFVKCAQGRVPERYFIPPAWRFFYQHPFRYPAVLANYPVLFIGDTAQILDLCLEGKGIGFVPRCDVEEALQEGILIQTTGPELDCAVTEYLVAKDFAKLTAPAKLFVQLLEARWQQTPDARA